MPSGTRSPLVRVDDASVLINQDLALTVGGRIIGIPGWLRLECMGHLRSEFTADFDGAHRQ